MKTSYVLPSGTYNIALSRDEFNQLVNGKCVSVCTNKIPCKTSRALFNGDGFDFNDKKEIPNYLSMHLTEPVDDIEEGYHNVQFLNIMVVDEDK